MMALSGVRSSWLMLARKRVLAKLAASASLRQVSSSVSWRLRSEMLRVTVTMAAPSTVSVSGRRMCASAQIQVSTSVSSPQRRRNSTVAEPACSACDRAAR